MTAWFLKTIGAAPYFFNTAWADTGNPPPAGGTTISLPNPLSCATFDCVANNIINGLLMLAIPIVAIMVLVGGFQILTAGGNPEKFTTGRRTILYAVVGYGVILLAKGAVLIIKSIVGG